MGDRPNHDGNDGRREKGTPGQTPAPPATTATKSKKILVVEDERVTQTVISLMLKGAGYTVTTAKDAAAALKVVRTELPDLMTLDIDLSRDAAGEVWDGFRVVEWLVRYRPDDHVPYIVISSGNPEAIKKRASSLQAFGYLTKPVNKQHLLGMVREAIGDPPTPPPKPPQGAQSSAPKPPPLPPSSAK